MDIFMVVALWIGLGIWCFSPLSDSRSGEGKRLKPRLYLWQMLVLALGLSIQVGLFVEWFANPRSGISAFLWIPPLATWGLLEGTFPPSTTRRKMTSAQGSDIND